jgi:hypothetical protein
VGRRWLAWVAVPALAAPGAGCGNERSQPTGLSDLAPQVSLVSFTGPSGDVSFGRPTSWSVVSGGLPQVAQISSGSAVASVYAYPRTDLSVDGAAVEGLRQRLLGSLRQRAPSFDVESSRVTEVDGAPAVEIIGRGRIAGHPVRTKSIHVYKGAAEYVIDAYARPDLFRRARTEGFDPMIATISLGGYPQGLRSGGVRAPD